MAENVGPDGKGTITTGGAQPDEKKLVKETIANKVLPWIFLIVLAPLLIIAIGVVANLQPFQRGDLYVYDLGLLLAGAAEAVAEPGAPHRRMQGVYIATLLLGIALAAQWVLASTDKEGHIGGQWWVAVVITLVTGIVAFASVYVGAIGSAKEEVRRWTP
jgi:hypothetical protein